MNFGYRRMLDGETKASGHRKRLLFFRFYGNFQSMAELRCTPKEYGHLAILRVTNGAVPDSSSPVGNFANNANEDRGFLSENRSASHGTEK